MSRIRGSLCMAVVAAIMAMSGFRSPVAGQVSGTGSELYDLGCASCHGVDGAGVDSDAFAFDDPLPDFTDCSFASREPDADWIIVAKAGGPVRGFSESMPAFGEAFDDEQLAAILAHVRTLCTDRAWPRGELNLPRPLVTEKAFPEDEAVWTTRVDAEGTGAVVNEITYEKRFGARSQIEVKLPFGFAETEGLEDGAGMGDSSWEPGLGDIAVGFKHATFHGESSILSFAGEVKIPTSTEDAGLGNDFWVFEPFVAFGQVLTADAFLHFQGGLEVPLWPDEDGLPSELFWRGVLGKTFTSGEFGRAWSPMVELLAAAPVGGSDDVVGSRDVELDIVPQMQITLNTRQHIMLNLGVRLPLTDADARDTQFIIYLLWDWFDGGFFDGW
jgi:mono/diheme cytochrome c family protein